MASGGQAQAEAMFAGLKPRFFPEAWIVLTAVPAVSSGLGMFPQLLYTNTHTGYLVSRVCLSTEVKE